MNDLCGFVAKLLSDNYDLGQNIKVAVIKEGDTNNSFFAFADKDGKTIKWYVRQYNTGEGEPELIYEHGPAVQRHLYVIHILRSNKGCSHPLDGHILDYPYRLHNVSNGNPPVQRNYTGNLRSHCSSSRHRISCC